MDQHIKILGILTIVFHGLFALLLLVIVPVFWGASLLAADNPIASGIIGTVGTILAVIILLMTLPGIIGGIGLLNRKSWSRILVMIANTIHILSFPLGTALAAYSFWVLTKEESVDMLGG